MRVHFAHEFPELIECEDNDTCRAKTLDAIAIDKNRRLT